MYFSAEDYRPVGRRNRPSRMCIAAQQIELGPGRRNRPPTVKNSVSIEGTRPQQLPGPPNKKSRPSYSQKIGQPRDKLGPCKRYDPAPKNSALDE